MTEERANRIVEAIKAYEDKDRLYAMTPEEATKEINAAGYDFTVEEMSAMAEAIVTVAKMAGENGELDNAALEQVAGGGATTGILLQGAQTLCVIGAAYLLYLAW